MPNLWVAIVAVAATAVLGRRLARGEGRYDELAAGGLVAVAAMIRPLDAVVLTVALVLLPFAVRRATLSWVAFLGLGLAAGWVPWLVEMTGRFGSPAEAFAAAARLGHTGRWSLFENVRQYLALSDGPSIGPVANPGVPASGVLWLLGLAILVTLGVRAATRGGLVLSLVVPTAAGVALAAEYVVFTDAQAPRFLLPALALLTIPAGFGLASMLAPIRDREGVPLARTVGIAAGILVVVWAVLQFVIASRVEAGVTERRSSAQRVGVRIRALAAQQPCWVYSEVDFPIVGYAAGCRAAPLGKVLGSWGDRARHLEAEGVRPFLVLLRGRAAPSPEGTTLLAEIPSRGSLRWFIYGGPASGAT